MDGRASADVELIAYHDLEARPSFKLALQVVDERWVLYATRFWEPGIWILDVTERGDRRSSVRSSRPRAHWSRPGRSRAHGLLVGSLEHRPPAWGGDPQHATDKGIVLYDVREPRAPVKLGRHRYGASGTHRNFYDGGRYVHATAAVPGHDGNIYSVLDVGDPAAPREVGRWFLASSTSRAARVRTAACRSTDRRMRWGTVATSRTAPPGS